MNAHKTTVWIIILIVCHAVLLHSAGILLVESQRPTGGSPKVREKRQSDEEDDPDLACEFGSGDELNFCGWAIDESSPLRFRWMVNRGSRALLLGGPDKDQTSADTEGGYAFYETSLYQSVGSIAQVTNDNALLFSPNISRTRPEGFCMTFYYSIDGLSAERLRVLLFRQFDGSKTPIWENSDMIAETWQKGEVVYTAGDRHQLLFEAIPMKATMPERYFRGHFAIDDIRFESVGSESAEFCLGHCTFEGGFCSWTNNDEEDEDDFDWQTKRGSQSFLTGPKRDFSSFDKDTPTGGYAAIENAKPRNPGDKAQLISPLFQATGDNNPVCMRFGTHMFGNGVGTLTVKQRYQDKDDNDVERIIWQVEGDAGNHWYMAQVTVSSPSPYKLMFEGIVGKNSMGTIAIDNISFRPGTCPIYPQTAVETSGDCSFEENICNWQNPTPQAGVDDFDWTRIQNYAQIQSLPLTDHSAGTSEGFYLTLSNTSPLPLRGGTRAWLVSPVMPVPQGSRCTEFYYYMFERTIDPSGPSLGSLRFYVRPADPEKYNQMVLIWRLNNHQRRKWHRARAVIAMGPNRAPPTEKYQIVIEGLWGHGGAGAIAIDDISFFDGDCANFPNEGTPIRGECFFDKDTCDWLDRTATMPTHETHDGERGATVRWRLASTISRPANVLDRTFGGTTGFVFFDVFNQPKLQKPILRSPSLKQESEDEENEGEARCFSFWFAQFGRGDDTSLSVQLVEVIEDDDGAKEQVSVLWRVDSKDKSIKAVEWTYAQVAVKTELQHYIQFSGESTDGGFAIDDITFNNVRCSIRPPSAQPPEPSDEESE